MGDVASVRVVKLMSFGAFAEVVPGVDGLIHISQIADRRIEKPEDVLAEGQIVDAKIDPLWTRRRKRSPCLSALCWIPLLTRSLRRSKRPTTVSKETDPGGLSLFLMNCDFFHAFRLHFRCWRGILSWKMYYNDCDIIP